MKYHVVAGIKGKILKDLKNKILDGTQELKVLDETIGCLHGGLSNE